MTHAPAAELIASLRDARSRTLGLVGDLSGERLYGPRLDILNPLLWELGHVAWFQERWALRHLRGLPPVRADGDALYDSSAVPHDTRWDLPLPSLAATRAYGETILDRIVERLGDRSLSADEKYFHLLVLFHEDMHGEAFAYTRQTLGYFAPAIAAAAGVAPVADRAEGDVEIAGGTLTIGAPRDTPFVFDNEKWAHPVDVAPFRMARAAVANGQFAEFVAAGGYAQPNLWTTEGWAWKERAAASYPIYWRRRASGWEQRVFDHWRALPADHPVIHVCWYEADAYCRWSNRRLPTEAEWEAAAASGESRSYPWGNAMPTFERANLDGWYMDTVSVHALAPGDTAQGCRQLSGNVWEWTASDFGPYPGFSADPYEDYSVPWFTGHKVLRGGCWATRARLLRTTYRNFYKPDRRDVFAGFRTCALS